MGTHRWKHVMLFDLAFQMKCNYIWITSFVQYKQKFKNLISLWSISTSSPLSKVMTYKVLNVLMLVEAACIHNFLLKLKNKRKRKRIRIFITWPIWQRQRSRTYWAMILISLIELYLLTIAICISTLFNLW